MPPPPTIPAKTESEQHYRAAADYLDLVLPPADVTRIVRALRRARPVLKRAKDIARASGLPILPHSDPDVARHIDRLRGGAAITPLLLVRGDLKERAPLTIAEGYHRLCAIYFLNEDAEVPCKVVER